MNSAETTIHYSLTNKLSHDYLLNQFITAGNPKYSVLRVLVKQYPKMAIITTIEIAASPEVVRATVSIPRFLLPFPHVELPLNSN